MFGMRGWQLPKMQEQAPSSAIFPPPAEQQTIRLDFPGFWNMDQVRLGFGHFES